MDTGDEAAAEKGDSQGTQGRLSLRQPAAGGRQRAANGHGRTAFCQLPAASCQLIEIVSVHRGSSIDPLQVFGLHRQHAILMLQHTLDEQERLPDDRHPLAIE